MHRLKQAGRDFMYLLDYSGYMSLDSEVVDDVFFVAFDVPARRTRKRITADVREAANVVRLFTGRCISARSYVKRNSYGGRTLYVEVRLKG